MADHTAPEASNSGGLVRHYKDRGLLFEPAHPDDGFALAPSLREIDEIELRSIWTGSEDTGLLLSKCVEVSTDAFTISDDAGEIHGLCGHGEWIAGPGRAGMGCIWLLTDDILFRHWPLTVTRFARDIFFPAMDVLYPLYGNFVASRNLLHARWLLNAGFRRVAPTVINETPFSLYLRRGS